MTDEELDAIDADLTDIREYERRVHEPVSSSGGWAFDHGHDLIAEVRRLRAELAEVKERAPMAFRPEHPDRLRCTECFAVCVVVEAGDLWSTAHSIGCPNGWRAL